MTDPSQEPDWEAFYQDYRKPGFIEGYEILNKLGGGVFGIVFKARKESIGKDYAVKFLKMDEPGVRDTAHKELSSVHLFAQVDHPNLVTIEDRGEVHGIPYIIMGYAGEETLRTRLDGGQIAREDGLRIFAQIARGVQALHDHSLVHFDLKPGNVFLRGDVARIGDYGLSKLVSVSHNTLSFGRGTPYYMAPELLERTGDWRSDIYSLGVILYEVLSGRVPFQGSSEWEVLRQHEDAEPDFPPSIEPRERRVIARCLQKDPAARFQSAQELIDELFAAGPGPAAAQPARHSPPPVPPPVPPQSPPRQHRAIHVPHIPPARRRRRGTGVGVIVLLALVLFPVITTATYVKEKRSRHRSARVEVRDVGRWQTHQVRKLHSKRSKLKLSRRVDGAEVILVEHTFRQLREREIEPASARARLRPVAGTAAVVGVNELLSLNYVDRGDLDYCKSLFEVLGPLEQKALRFRAPLGSGPVSASVGSRNLAEAERFRTHVQRRQR